MELEEKIDNTMRELQFLNKSKNLLTKNIKNEDDRITELNNALEKLRQEKYKLALKKNKLLNDFEDYQEKVERFDPEFVRKLREDIDASLANSDQTLPASDIDISTSPTRRIDEIRNQIKKWKQHARTTKEHGGNAIC